jgi:hypothetical protein
MLAIALLFLTAFFMSLGEERVSLAAHSDQVVTRTVTVGSSVSTLLSLPQQIFNGPFTVLSTTGTNLPCEFWAFNFTADTGQYVSGNFSSDNPISFFVVQTASYQRWLKADTCGNVGDAIVSQLIGTSYSFNAAIPTSGMWTIVFVNSSNAKNADGSLAAYLSLGSYTVTQPLMGTITATITSSSATVSSSSESTTIDGFPIASIVVGILVGLVAIVILRRRNHC